MTEQSVHRSVLLEETLELLRPGPGGRYVDATLGGGGHAAALLEASAPDGCVLGLDRDAESLERTVRRLARYGERFRGVHSDYAGLARCVGEAGWPGVDGVLMDLGLSSDQLAEGRRGFSFQAEGPLDMRMDRSGGITAADIVNGWSEEELMRILRAYGEEPMARRIVRVLLRRREQGPIESTVELAELVERAKGGRRSGVHPATQTFQALRMAVNHELDSLKEGLDGGLGVLKPGGRIAVIAFHSLEDRMVKQTFQAHVGREVSLQAGGSRWEGVEPKCRKVTGKPVVAGECERTENTRSRSAKLRVVERM